MPTYVSLIHWTDQGIKNYKDTMKRLEDFTKLAESKGGRVREDRAQDPRGSPR